MGVRELRAKYDVAFQEFFTHYPRHTHRLEAFNAFIDVAEEGEDLQAIIAKAASYGRNVDPSQLQYVPAPHRWLKARRWEDEDLFTDEVVSTRAWFGRAYQDGDAAAVQKKYGFIFPDPQIPQGVDPMKFHEDARKAWIGAVARHVLHGDPLPD